LEKRDEGDMAETKRHAFLGKIMHDKYDVVIQQQKGKSTRTFEQCIWRIQTCKQELESNARKVMKAKARRNKLVDDKEKSSSEHIPKFHDSNVRQGLLKWRYVWDKGGHHITANKCNGGQRKKKENKQMLSQTITTLQQVPAQEMEHSPRQFHRDLLYGPTDDYLSCAR
jgi:hypothetical protein